MNVFARRRAAALAERRMQLAEDRWSVRMRALRMHIARHRAAWTLGLGATAGIVSGLLPMRRVSLVGRSMTSVLAFVLRSPLGTSLIARAMQRNDSGDGTSTHRDS